MIRNVFCELDINTMDTQKGTNSHEHHIPVSKPIMYIHAGLPKTGTTSIQQFLKSNREALKNFGVLYPATGVHGTGHVKFAISFLSEKYLQRMRKSNLLCDDEGASKIKHQIENEISESGTKIKSVIISAESFDGTDKEGIKQLVQLYQGDYQLKIVIYLRRQDRYAESLHAQAYRVREMAFDRDQLLTKGHFNYDFYINLWKKSLGSENLILREFPENAFDGQLIDDFLTAVSIENFPVPKGIERSNRRMDRLVLEYIRHHTGLKFGDDMYFRVENLLIEYSRLHPVEKRFKFFFSPQEHQSILEDCSKSNTYLSEKYFNGGLFKNIPNPNLTTEWEKFPGLSKSQIESIDAFLLEHGFDNRMLGRH
jgi:hypothetical protein